MHPTKIEPGSLTRMYEEARESADAVIRLIAANRERVARVAARLRDAPPGAVITIARGSSDNACTYGRYLIENGLGITSASLGPSLGSIYQAPAPTAGSLCFVVSQSGASPDLIAAVERAKAGGAFVVGLINQPGAPLARLCDEPVILDAGPEHSVAATKSFVSSMTAFAWIIGEWTADRELLGAVHDLPALLRRAWAMDWTPVDDTLRTATNLFVLGRGPGLGAAQEAALKLKETCGLHAEAMSAAEVLHGPMALVSPGFPILAFAQRDASLPTSRATAESLAARGAAVMFAGDGPSGTTLLPTVAAHPAIEPILMVQSFYRAAANLSIARGFDPDHPPHLSKVTRTY